jgi:hypothetical protein
MFTGLSLANLIGRVKAGEYVEARLGLRRKLHISDRRRLLLILLINVSKIKIEIGHEADPASRSVMMCWMIAELIKDISFGVEREKRYSNQRMLFPDPATKARPVSDVWNPTVGKHTFPMNPQQGARQLPFLEDILIENPRCGSLVLSATRNVVIRRWIRRS